ncbi:MAG TPA: hypothetical protein VGO68_10155 [Pyrinomonadaceae bacterium]|jgi:hypothetical protein|nr:hypothetical protein [Pyrinomonadaceae bacterium]
MKTSDGAVASRNGYGPLFEANGYVVIKQFLPRIMCDYIAENIKLLEASSGLEYGDNQVERAFSAGSPVVTETLLDIVTPVLEQAINCALYPTYSYLRVYLTGAELAKHMDRPSCEVSATVPISYDASEIWPLYLETGDEATRIELEPGDALIYKGIEVPHWREPFAGGRQVQVFLHYVRKNGEYEDYKFDQRPCLSHQTTD